MRLNIHSKTNTSNGMRSPIHWYELTNDNLSPGINATAINPKPEKRVGLMVWWFCDFVFVGWCGVLCLACRFAQGHHKEEVSAENIR